LVEEVVEKVGCRGAVLKTKSLRLSGAGWNGAVIAAGETWVIPLIGIVSV